MPSTKEEGTTAATQQLGSMSIGETVERNIETNADKNEAPAKFCSACDKKSNTLKKCTACKCVWYCDKECQNKHHKEHRKECKRIKKELDKRGGKLDVGTEMDVGPLGKLPPREECPICMRALPIHTKLQCYFACCGKTLCCGCNFQHQMKSEEEPTCAFCRTVVPKSKEEILARLRKRVKLKDPIALCDMASKHGSGGFGLPVDKTKCIELLRQSADLGYSSAQYQLGNYLMDGEMGLQRNEKEAVENYTKAAEDGNFYALHNLGCAEKDNGRRSLLRTIQSWVRREGRKGNFVTAMRLWRLSASGGFKLSIETLIDECFEEGLLHHGDLAETLQAMYRARAEMKSEDRDQYTRHLKDTGKYKEEYYY